MREIVELRWIGYFIEAITFMILVHSVLKIIWISDRDDSVSQRNRRILRQVLRGDVVVLVVLVLLLISWGHRIQAVQAGLIGVLLGVIWGPLFALIQRDSLKAPKESSAQKPGSNPLNSSANTPPPK